MGSRQKKSVDDMCIRLQPSLNLNYNSKIGQGQYACTECNGISFPMSHDVQFQYVPMAIHEMFLEV